MKFRKTEIAILIIAAAAMEATLFWPVAIYIALGLINLAAIWGVWRLARKSPAKFRWPNFVILPVIFISGAIAYASLLPEAAFINKILTQVIFAATVYFLYYYFRQLEIFLRQPAEPNNFIDFSSLAGWLALFLAAAAVFGLQLFLGLAYWIMLLIIILLIFGLTYQFFWLNNLAPKENRLLVGLIVLVLAQLAWALYFLPFDYNVLGLLLVLGYYLLLTAGKLYLAASLNRHNFKPLLIYISVIICLIFLTVRWR